METNFYTKCAELLGTEYQCEAFPYHKRTRWNNRTPGNGRYPGYGIIRKFGDKVQVSLRYPIVHSKVYDSEEEVLTFLEHLGKSG